MLCFLVFPFSVFAQENTLYFTIRQRQRSSVIGENTELKGLYRGNYKDTVWQHLGWKNNIVWSVAVDTTSHGKYIFLGCLNGVMRSMDFGKTWKVITDWRVSDVLQVQIDPVNPQIIYASTPTGVFKSTNFGETWKAKNKGLNPTHQTFISCLFIDQSNPQTILAGTAGGIVFSNNGGNQWQSLALENIEIHTLVANPMNERELLCATENEGIFQSMDKGKSWKTLNEGLPTQTIYTIVYEPQNPTVLYCGGHQSGICKSEDGGKTWQTLSNALSGKSIRKIVLHPQEPHLVFVACLEGGLYRSEDSGQTFSCVGECNAQVWDIFLD